MSWTLTRRIVTLAAATALAVSPVVAAHAATTGDTDPRGGESSSPEIVGGSSTTTEDYPFAIALEEDDTQFCGGTLVADTKVVTAAHCVADAKPSQITAVGGRTDLHSSQGTKRSVHQIWVHPKYDSGKNTSDVAVLTLSDRMPYTAAPMVTSSDTGLYMAGTEARILGWGATSEGGSPSGTLRTAQVHTISNAACEKAYDEKFNGTHMVCAGEPQGEVDSCQGDSGGPLLIKGKLAGVVSWGNGCARPDNPGVYTRLTTYADALAEQIHS